jgi:hypothetical protein
VANANVHARCSLVGRGIVNDHGNKPIFKMNGSILAVVTANATLKRAANEPS